MKKQRHNSSEPWPFLDPDEWEKCCNKEEPGTGGQPQDCVGDWKQKLKDARKEMEEASATYYQANKFFTNAASWKAKLKKWKEEAESAHSKAVDVYHKLKQFLEAVDRTKPAKTAKAVKSVLCLVKAIFNDVNDLLRVSNSVEEPMGEIQELKQWIECDDSLDANKKQEALKCITPFEDKMKLVNGAQEELLTKLLEIFHSAHILIAAVDKLGVEEKEGLKWQLMDLKRRISGKSAYTKRERKRCHPEAEPSFELPCNGDIVNPTKHFFPIRKMEDVPGSTDSEYYADILGLFCKAEDNEEEAKLALADAEEKRNDAVAYYNGLNDAINAAEAARPSK
jgi:phage pi2 protein 07